MCEGGAHMLCALCLLSFDFYFVDNRLVSHNMFYLYVKQKQTFTFLTSIYYYYFVWKYLGRSFKWRFLFWFDGFYEGKCHCRTWRATRSRFIILYMIILHILELHYLCFASHVPFLLLLPFPFFTFPPFDNDCINKKH